MECILAGETEVLGENLSEHHFCPSQNPTWPDPGRRGGKPVTNRLCYGAALHDSKECKWMNEWMNVIVGISRDDQYRSASSAIVSARKGLCQSIPVCSLQIWWVGRGGRVWLSNDAANGRGCFFV
jgi:hypothetical protein